MSVKYNEEFKKEVVQIYLQGNHSMSELAAGYNVGKSPIKDWVKKYGEECKYRCTTTKIADTDSAREIRRLNQLLKEKDKEIEFLKKQQHSSPRKSNSGISVY